MSPKVTCGCVLCGTETHLLSHLAHFDVSTFYEPSRISTCLQQDFSVSSLLSHLRASPAGEKSDKLLRELFVSFEMNSNIVETVLVVAFVPMLHRTVRQVVRQQSGLSLDDVAQQSLSVLLQILRSKELRSRQSHFAFAISRSVKRHVFEWAHRESAKTAFLHPSSDWVLAAMPIEDSFEPYAVLRHFLHRCVTRRLLKPYELNLLIEFKLNGTNGGELADLNGAASNAVRQKLKRLLAKLRQWARYRNSEANSGNHELPSLALKRRGKAR